MTRNRNHGSQLLTLEHAAASHVGRRDNNEDALCVAPEHGLFAVADGMGGYAGGEVASAIVAHTLQRWFANPPGDAGSGVELVTSAVRQAHDDVRAKKVGALAEMGSTVAALVVRDGHAVIAHVGDSRVYRLRDGELAQLTCDHSLAEEMRAAGGHVGADFPYRNVITRAIGMREGARVDVVVSSLEAGDVFLLCTDGLTEGLGDDELAALLTAPPLTAAPALVRAAYDAGGRDNITAVVVRVRAV
ncbi:MAG: serine/threonine-protein phosphatase [Deltaproteobacteria bacterium]|nr:serine/threonine-protein phosphatase [Deltaproteobacteria bacterium]